MDDLGHYKLSWGFYAASTVACVVSLLAPWSVAEWASLLSLVLMGLAGFSAVSIAAVDAAAKALRRIKADVPRMIERGGEWVEARRRGPDVAAGSLSLQAGEGGALAVAGDGGSVTLATESTSRAAGPCPHCGHEPVRGAA